jgi:hypothetical protein
VRGPWLVLLWELIWIWDYSCDITNPTQYYSYEEQLGNRRSSTPIGKGGGDYSTVTSTYSSSSEGWWLDASSSGASERDRQYSLPNPCNNNAFAERRASSRYQLAFVIVVYVDNDPRRIDFLQ